MRKNIATFMALIGIILMVSHLTSRTSAAYYILERATLGDGRIIYVNKEAPVHEEAVVVKEEAAVVAPKCPNPPPGCIVDKDGCPIDSDKDGVCDGLDKCPGTPAGVSVDEYGCPLDSDKDGVYDYLDKCPGTPAGLKVDLEGCPLQVSITLKIEFDTGKSDVKTKYNDEIKRVADFMKQYPLTKTVIEGHTDNVGREAANVRLSQSRANAVKAYLIDNFGIEKDRVQAVGYGPKKPIASNATAEGKQKNRRVEAIIKTVETK